jgi:hypothetical protein
MSFAIRRRCNVDTLGDTVKLDKQDSDFMKKKSQLKALGYRWDNENTQWVKKAA